MRRPELMGDSEVSGYKESVVTALYTLLDEKAVIDVATIHSCMQLFLESPYTTHADRLSIYAKIMITRIMKYRCVKWTAFMRHMGELKAIPHTPMQRAYLMKFMAQYMQSHSTPDEFERLYIPKKIGYFLTETRVALRAMADEVFARYEQFRENEEWESYFKAIFKYLEMQCLQPIMFSNDLFVDDARKLCLYDHYLERIIRAFHISSGGLNMGDDHWKYYADDRFRCLKRGNEGKMFDKDPDARPERGSIPF
ncbi:MAG: hypothetical protein FWC09_08370 [Lachnospiraceae bacterium]|nr:hypothetical protein [Lachnospiraceae bacterium]